MPLAEREVVIVRVANALTIYAIKHSEGDIPSSTTPHQFVLDAMPGSAVSADIIDDVFAALDRSGP